MTSVEVPRMAIGRARVTLSRTDRADVQLPSRIVRVTPEAIIRVGQPPATSHTGTPPATCGTAIAAT